MQYYTGEILLVDFSNSIGHQQGGVRPAVVVSNNIGNIYSPMLEVLPVTSKRINSNQPTHVTFKASEVDGLDFDSTIEAEGKISINKFQVKRKLGKLSEEQLELVAIAMVYATPIVIKAFSKGIQDTALFQKIYNA